MLHWERGFSREGVPLSTLCARRRAEAAHGEGTAGHWVLPELLSLPGRLHGCAAHSEGVPKGPGDVAFGARGCAFRCACGCVLIAIRPWKGFPPVGFCVFGIALQRSELMEFGHLPEPGPLTAYRAAPGSPFLLGPLSVPCTWYPTKEHRLQKAHLLGRREWNTNSSSWNGAFDVQNAKGKERLHCSTASCPRSPSCRHWAGTWAAPVWHCLDCQSRGVVTQPHLGLIHTFFPERALCAPF